MKVRSRTSTLYEVTTARVLVSRCSRGSVSGRNHQTIPRSTTPKSARNTNTARQPHSEAIAPPTVGASIGATPMTSMSRDSTADASAPVSLSRMTAMAVTPAAALPTPWRIRSTISGTTSITVMHSSDARMCTPRPTKTGRGARTGRTTDR